MNQLIKIEEAKRQLDFYIKFYKTNSKTIIFLKKRIFFLQT